MSDEHEFELTVPFVCCEIRGGVYHTPSFVAGANYGRVRAELEKGTDKYACWAEQAMHDQYDLLAMQAGYTLTVSGQLAALAIYKFEKVKDADNQEDGTSDQGR